MTRVIDAAEIAEAYRAEIRAEVAALPQPLVLTGILSTDHGPSATYAEYTRKGCESVGVQFDLRQVRRLDAEEAIHRANEDRSVSGIIVYYPVFGTDRDAYLRDSVALEKDVEGLHSFWTRCLYENRRFVDEAKTKKAILPCTPLAILKLIEAAGAFGSGERPLAGKTACIFNRSEVVGWPLAAMLANDGARVVSFDIDGPLSFEPAPAGGAHRVDETTISRAEALASADIVVTGVPSKTFDRVRAAEVRAGAVCLNFSTHKNFEDDIVGRAGVFVPRVGPMTVTMALRNTVRLHRDHHALADTSIKG